MSQRYRILKRKWDCLIILDACRYDYFKRLHSEFLTGKLERVISPATGTPGWLKKTFNGRFRDTVYVSANPYVNSQVEVAGFDAKKIFHKVLDVWNWGWDDTLGTIPPNEVTKGVKKAKRKYPNKKIIAHYLQPHAPYLSLGKKYSALFNGRIIKGEENTLEHFFDRIKAWFRWRMIDFLGVKRASKIRELLHLSPLTPVFAALREVGEEGVKQAYKKNLEAVLKEVSEIVKIFSGKVIVTSDHGELLGEEGLFGHTFYNHPLLKEVPWFEVKRSNKRNSLLQKRRE